MDSDIQLRIYLQRFNELIRMEGMYCQMPSEDTPTLDIFLLFLTFRVRVLFVKSDANDFLCERMEYDPNVQMPPSLSSLHSTSWSHWLTFAVQLCHAIVDRSLSFRELLISLIEMPALSSVYTSTWMNSV